MSTAKFDSVKDIHKTTTYQAGVIQAASNRNLQKICDDILEPFGITKAQWLIIGTVLDHGKDGIRLTELSEILGTNLSYLTNTINFLETKNVLYRAWNDQDSRSKFIFVEPAFARKCSKIENALRVALKKTIYKDIDPQEFLIYLKVMAQLAKLD